MADSSLWQIEERLWTGGGDTYSLSLDPSCVMVFPPPTGILKDRETILRSLEGAPRWAGVEMAERVLVQPWESLAVLAYRATAKRQGEDASYRAVCTSTYLAHEAGWRMVQHQQTLA